MRDFDIDSDLKQEKFQNIKLVQGDRGNKIKINVYEDGQPVNLAGCSVTAKYKRADGEIINDGVIENIHDNSFDAVMDSSITKVAGTLKMLFTIEKDDVKVSTFLLLADVRESIGENTGSSGGNTGGGSGEVTIDLSNYYKKIETYSKNQIDARFKDIVNNFTTEQTDSSFIIKYENKTIAEIPIGNMISGTETFGNILSNVSIWNVMGDSISDETINPKTKYMTLLKNKYSITTVNNYGKNSVPVAKKNGVTSQLELFNNMSSSCDLVTILAGTNDFAQNLPLGDENSTSEGDFYYAVDLLITKLKNKYPKANIIWILPLDMKNGTFGITTDGKNNLGNTMEQYRDIIRLKCNEHSIKIIDLSNNTNLNPDTITSDGVHPTETGQQVLANELEISKPSIPNKPIVCIGITIDKSTLSFTNTSPQTLTATISPTNCIQSITWTVSPTGICTINDGIVTPIKNGTCTITATCGSKIATCNVTVTGIQTSIPCTNIALDKSTLSFTTIDTQTLVATLTPSNTTDNIVWSVSPSGICTVNNGVVTPVANGNCVIMATCGNQTVTCNVTVTGIPISRLVTFKGIASGGHGVTALCNSDNINKGDVIKVKIKFSNPVNVDIPSTPSMVGCFEDSTGLLGNSQGSIVTDYAKNVSDDEYYIYSYNVTKDITQPYMKMLFYFKVPDTSIDSSFNLDYLKVLINDTPIEILNIGTYFTSETCEFDSNLVTLLNQ